jgi:enterochelin esterase-like enzyme
MQRRLYRAGCALLALVFGLSLAGALENDQFAYYTSWSALLGTKPQVDLVGPVLTLDSTVPHGAIAAQLALMHPKPGHGVLAKVTLPGLRSGVRRGAFVYLPPQYFQPRYRASRFPVLELLNGSPGSPGNWLGQIDTVGTMDSLLAKHKVGPMVLVMPSTNSHLTSSLECVDAVSGVKDDTYLTDDVRADVLQSLRVSPSRTDWGLAGYSTGGYCAVNLLLRHSDHYAAAASMDGYFTAIQDKFTGNLFRGQAAARNQNSPTWTWLYGDTSQPVALYLQAGTHDPLSFLDALRFHNEVVTEGPDLGRRFSMAFTVQTGAGHSFAAWHAGIPSVLQWAWNQLADPDLKAAFPVIPAQIGDLPQSQLNALATALLGRQAIPGIKPAPSPSDHPSTVPLPAATRTLPVQPPRPLGRPGSRITRAS